MFNVKLALSSPKAFFILHLYSPESSIFGSESSNRISYVSSSSYFCSLYNFIWVVSVIVWPSLLHVISGDGFALTLHSMMTNLPLFCDKIRGFSTNVGPSPSGSGSASIFKFKFALLSPNSFCTWQRYVPPSAVPGSYIRTCIQIIYFH